MMSITTMDCLLTREEIIEQYLAEGRDPKEIRRHFLQAHTGIYFLLSPEEQQRASFVKTERDYGRDAAEHLQKVIRTFNSYYDPDPEPPVATKRKRGRPRKSNQHYGQ